MTDNDIYKIEHDCIAYLILSDCHELSAEYKTALLGYIDGVNTMAAAVVDKMRKDQEE